ncbi:hypothetical protein PIB30_117297 [Stylosanthes scabra]|uniref:Protein decapping 5 n=1 Tax=Stylosanthes scabra TaxID=79078 RepID=A0ABU6RDW5_9FABA|nr:hypothetical protein [Stylosanthes scabra]
MASDTASSRSSTSADSYIGCLISLTSKSEIRYEGVLYNISTEESSIGLRNVRSFGTEGRKKDGPQIPPSDKVYEYILFRGTDIKDLQVKSSPPVQPTPPINADPAIIQSQYPIPRPVTTTSTNIPPVTGSLTDFSSQNTQLGLQGSNYQGPLPLYQPGGNLGSWGASPNGPNANGAGLAMPPMYWQGYYGAPNGLPQLQQQSLLRPPPGLSMPSSMQQPMQFPNYNPSLPAAPSNLPELPSALLPLSTSSANVTGTSIPPSNFPSTLLPLSASSASAAATSVLPSNMPSTLPPAPSTTLAPEALPISVPNKIAAVSLPAATVTTNGPSLTPFTNGAPDIGAVVPPVNKPNAVSGSSLPYQSASPLTPALAGSLNSIHMDAPAPPLVTPGQLLQSGPTVGSSSQPSPTPHKDVEVVPSSSTVPPEPSVPVSAETQPPILPLPVASRPNHRPGGAPMHAQHGYGYRGRGSGRGRGTGGSRPVAKFTEDFDFMAMNEKFKKDEVWGHLGKSNKSHSKDRDGEDASDEDDIQDEDNGDASKTEVRTVYNKDDFFDTLSCNSLDHDSQNGRVRYSEQIKIDTETFGDFSRHRGGWGGRGGRSRGGGYHGRGYGYGYGYAGRGRGRGMSNRP